VIFRKSALFGETRSFSLSRTIDALRRIARDRRAATAVEYAVVAAGVALAVAATVMSLGSTVKSTFYDRLVALM
jgi:pilus assembly protein Flp/PilA